MPKLIASDRKKDDRVQLFLDRPTPHMFVRATDPASSHGWAAGQNADKGRRFKANAFHALLQVLSSPGHTQNEYELLYPPPEEPRRYTKLLYQLERCGLLEAHAPLLPDGVTRSKRNKRYTLTPAGKDVAAALTANGWGPLPCQS